MKKSTHPRYQFSDLVDLMKQLRAPDGCPWDREQTTQSLQPYLLEEAHEVIEALDRGHPDEICEELGDLLLQIVFLSQINAEQQKFSIEDVIHSITAKLIRRHPHVFEGRTFDSAAELNAQWEKIKKKEKNERASRDRTDPAEIPPSLPALMRARKLLAKKKIDSDTELTQALKDLVLHDADDSRQQRSHRIAAAICSLVAIAHQSDIDSEQVLRQYLKGSEINKKPEREGG